MGRSPRGREAARRARRRRAKARSESHRFDGPVRPFFDSPLASLICHRKVRFETRREAKDFMLRRGIETQEPYPCEGCRGFHLRTKRRRWV